MNILIVEDNQVVSLKLQAILKHEACCSIVAATGIDTLNCLETYIPDLIFMDIDLPDFSGWDLTKIIRKKMGSRWLPIIFHSSHVNHLNADVVPLAGGDDYICKPASAGEVKALLNEVRPILNALHKYGLQ